VIADAERVATAAREWTASAEGLRDVADRLAGQAPEAEARLRGRTGADAGTALRRAERALRADADDTAAGGEALAEVAAALHAVRVDPGRATRDRLATAVREAIEVMRGIHADPAPPPHHRRPDVDLHGTAVAVARLPSLGAPTVAPAVTAAVITAATLAGAARSVRTTGAGAVPPSPRPLTPGAPNPAPRGRGSRDARSRTRRPPVAGFGEWDDVVEDDAGPAVLGADPG
jgi:hypothetical protein